MSRVLVTGNAGFIGFHVARRLLELGQEVLGYDGMTEYYDVSLKQDRLALLEPFDQFTHVTAMLEDIATLNDVFATFQPEYVIHLAAQAGVRYSIENPHAYISSNIVGTHNLLEGARLNRPTHLMLASTSSVYGGNTKVPFSESDRADAPVSLYAATKKSTEALAHSYSHLWNIPTTAFRFFTVYGPWGRPDMALFKFVRAALAGESIDVYGEGKMRRDFTYIDDLVDSIVALMDVPPQKDRPLSGSDTLSPVSPYRVVNIAGGAPVRLMDFIAAIEQALGFEIKKSYLPMQPGDVVQTFADNTLLRDLVGTTPSTSTLDGTERFINWYTTYDSKGVSK